MSQGGEEAVETHSLSLVTPSKKDRIKILVDVENATAGAMGTLIGIDAADGIVKLDNSSELVIIDMTHLGKLGEK